MSGNKRLEGSCQKHTVSLPLPHSLPFPFWFLCSSFQTVFLLKKTKQKPQQQHTSTLWTEIFFMFMSLSASVWLQIWKWLKHQLSSVALTVGPSFTSVLVTNSITKRTGQPISPLALCDVIWAEITSGLASLLNKRQSECERVCI